jgi:hypothetical protein
LDDFHHHWHRHRLGPREIPASGSQTVEPSRGSSAAFSRLVLRETSCLT